MTATSIAPRVAWSWSSVVRGIVLAVPASVAALHDVQTGAALAIGLMPVAPLPLAPTRRGRLRSGLFGVLAAASLVVGGLLATWPPLAVFGMLSIGVVAGRLAASRPAGMLVLSLCLPLIGVALSYPGLSTVGPLALLIVLGSAYAVVVALLWPARPSGPPPEPLPPLPRAYLVRYGWLVGLAGAVCAAIGFALDLEHVGWAPAAALLVMRPRRPVQGLRSVDRLADVVLGATLAIALVTIGLPDWGYALAVGLAAIVATATGGSRWYVLPFFTTFYVFLMLLADDPGDARSRFWERVGETALGVAVAAFFAYVVPALLDRRRPAKDTAAHTG